MIVKSTPKGRLLAFCNSMALKPVRVARVAHACQLCGLPINRGDEFKGESGRAAHLFCIEAVSRELRGTHGKATK